MEAQFLCGCVRRKKVSLGENRNFAHVALTQVEVCVFFSSRRRHTRCSRDWSSDVCSSDLTGYRKPRHRRNPRKHRPSQDFCTLVRVSQCCCWRANKGKGSTGGAPEYSTHCLPAGGSFWDARWFGGYEVRIRWWHCLIC